MKVLGSLATISLIVSAMDGCAAGAGADDPSAQTPDEEQALDLSVDSLDVVHGALRVSATMVDGAADVSVRLGGDCEPREVGGGLSTRSTLVWSLGDRDVAEAIGCGLMVRARIRDGARWVNKVAEIGLTVDMAAQERENADEGPQLQSVASSEMGISVVFASVARGARLATGESLLEATPPASEPATVTAPDDTRRFTIPRIEFARSVLRARPLYLDGSSFVTSLSVSGTSVQGEPQAADEPQAEPAETPPEESDDPEG